MDDFLITIEDALGNRSNVRARAGSDTEAAAQINQEAFTVVAVRPVEKLTKSERKLLSDVSKRGMLFIDDGASDAWTVRWIKKLVSLGYVTKDRKSGPFGAFGCWLTITDAGWKELNGV